MSHKLMTHVVVGYPTLDLTDTVIDALVAGGSSYIELQIPFSDPMADGPLIMHASEVALAHGVTVKDIFEKATLYTKSYPAVKFLFVLYANTTMNYGIKSFCTKAAACGIYGLIIPDLPFDTPEGVTLARASRDAGLTLVPVIAPSTTDARLAQICESEHKLIYAASYMGVTGERAKWDHVPAYIARIRKYTKAQIAVGFGTKTRDDVRAVCAVADIAVVGSEIVNRIKTPSDSVNVMRAEIQRYVQSLSC